MMKFTGKRRNGRFLVLVICFSFLFLRLETWAGETFKERRWENSDEKEKDPMEQIEIPEGIHYRIGDVQVKTIGNKQYSFRCIDDDYEDVMGNSQGIALFLCDTVIRSDIDGVSRKMKFGNNNNYKYSNIRQWILQHGGTALSYKAYIGITDSYTGATEEGACEQFSQSCLKAEEREFQQLEDSIFILSVEEAVKYRDYLWKFNGSKKNNPDTQLSPYSKGYYLRTPQNSGMSSVPYGNGIYTVDLVEGNIHPADVSDTSIGIRPVMVIPQG